MKAIVFFPTTCRRCLKVTHIPFTPEEIVQLLGMGGPITLFSPCHNDAWIATDQERDLLNLVAQGHATLHAKYPDKRQPEFWEQQPVIDGRAFEYRLTEFSLVEAANTEA